MAKDIQVCFAVHVDAVAGWIGSYGGEDSPADISRGMFAGEVGTMRLLELFRRWGIKTSWFVPGPFGRDVSRSDEARRGRRTRVRRARLHATKIRSR